MSEPRFDNDQDFVNQRIKVGFKISIVLIVLSVAILSCLACQGQTKQTVKSYLKASGIKYSEIALKQAILESGNFQSPLCVNHNNIFGMKMPHQRPTLAIGQTEKGFAIYRCWRESVLDYRMWQDYHFKRHKITDYYAFLDRVYCSNSYSQKLKTIK